jgi:glycosyltransferase A (GT-A) superfamily protein (DUF2064 family)
MGAVTRYLVLFAREPARQAREKGFAPNASEDATALFSSFAQGWHEAARRAGARFVVSTPVEDRSAWRRVLAPTGADPIWILQEGAAFGQRLQRTARRAAAWGGSTVVVGGDVPPSAELLGAAFGALEAGSDGVLAPSEDGGVSLLGLKAGDLDLLRTVGPRRRDVFHALNRALSRRGRSIAILGSASDVDGRAALRRLLGRGALSPDLARIARALLAPVAMPETREAPSLRAPFLLASPVLRGPPLAA